MKFESKYSKEEIKKDPSILVGKFFIYKTESYPRFIYKIESELYEPYKEFNLPPMKRIKVYYYINNSFSTEEECFFYFSCYFGDFSFFHLNKDFIII